MILLVMTLAFPGLFAEPPVEGLLRARSLQELLLAEEHLSQQSQWSVGCALELEKDLFPENCLYWLDWSEAQIDLIPLVERRRHLIERLCVRWAPQWGSQEKIRWLFRRVPLSPSCRQALATRQQDLEYLQGTPSARPLKSYRSYGNAQGTNHHL